MTARLTVTAWLAGLTVTGLVAAPGAQPATAAGIPVFRPGHVPRDVSVRSGVTPAQAERAAAASPAFTQFKATVKVGTTSYTYVMAGKNPAIKHSSPAATIKAELVPVIIKFANGDTWDPAKIDSCDSGASALTRVQDSPLVKSRSWTWGGTAIGTGQVTDAYQRADFWQYAKPGAINPSYAVNLAWATLAPVTINVPDADAATAAISCGNGLLGAVSLDWLDPYLQKTVIPSLSGEGVSPATVPIFLLHNVVEYLGTTTDCCAIGYHGAYSTSSGGIQTYALSMYDNSGFFTNLSDILALTHEVAEWQNDPYGTNPTPAWGHVGQVAGCQSNLEVGDPLSDTAYPVKVGTFTYHPQELAFFSWFYHQKPSTGVNGWYSDQGTFKTDAASCS